MDSLEVCPVENIAQKGGYGIGTVALIPVVTVANHNTQFGFTFNLVNVIAGAVPDVLTIQGFDSQPMSGRGQVAQLNGII